MIDRSNNPPEETPNLVPNLFVNCGTKGLLSSHVARADIAVDRRHLSGFDDIASTANQLRSSRELVWRQPRRLPPAQAFGSGSGSYGLLRSYQGRAVCSPVFFRGQAM